MEKPNSLMANAVSIVDTLWHLFPDPKSVPKDYQLRGRPGWVFVAESNPCMEQCNVLTLELRELAPRLEQQLREFGIEFSAEKIRDALQIDGFETSGAKRGGRGIFIDRKAFMSQMRVLRSYFTVEEVTKQEKADVPAKPRGSKPDPKKEEIERRYLKGGGKARYIDIVESLELKAWNGRTPYKRVECVLNAMHQRDVRSKKRK